MSELTGNLLMWLLYSMLYGSLFLLACIYIKNIYDCLQKKDK